MLVAFRVYVNDQLFQLAFAIIEGEKNDNWDRFMACIRARVMQRPDLCVISDRHKDIIMVMNNEHLGSHPGHASHHFCVQYLASYFHSRFHDKSLKMLTVRATYEQQPTNSCMEWSTWLKFGREGVVAGHSRDKWALCHKGFM